MERQGVSTHKDSGIENDANDWAIETMGDAKYPLELFLRVITVSLETMKIVRSLPKLDIQKLKSTWINLSGFFTIYSVNYSALLGSHQNVQLLQFQ